MKKKKIIYTILICINIVILSIGSTYAYISASVSSKKDDIQTSSGNFSINLDITPIAPLNDNKMIPMKDELSEKAYTGYNNNPCIDKNGATVCYLYEIRVYDYNNNQEYVSASLNIKTSNITNLSFRVFDEEGNSIIITEDEDNQYIKKIESGLDMEIGNNFDVKDKKELKLKLMIWLTDTGISQNDTDIGTFSGSVTVYAGTGGKITGKISSLIEGKYAD